MEGGEVGEDRKKRQMKFQLYDLQYRGPAHSLSLASSSVDIRLRSSMQPISLCHKDTSYGIFLPSVWAGPVEIRRLITMQSVRTEPKRGQDNEPWLHLWRKLLMATLFPPHLPGLDFYFSTPLLPLPASAMMVLSPHSLPAKAGQVWRCGGAGASPGQRVRGGGRGVHAVTEGKRGPPKALKASLVPQDALITITQVFMP